MAKKITATETQQLTELSISRDEAKAKLETLSTLKFHLKES
jgi:hypothetical protein